MTIRVGPAGWSYADWAGKVYPRRRPPGFSELGWIASLFDMVEINSPFYRPPAPSMAEAWMRKVPTGFTFTVKVWRRLTHDRLPFTSADAQPYLDGLAPLSGALGAVLAQFPWSFRDTPANRDRIGALRELFRDQPLVVEVRHASWNRPESLEFLRGKGVGFCNIDQPASREGITGTHHVMGKVGYVRLHGRNRKAWFDPKADRDEKYDYLYTEEELGEWIDAIRAMERSATVFVVANNHYRGQAVANALQIKAALTGASVRAPDELVDAFPQLAKIAERRQPGLF